MSATNALETSLLSLIFTNASAANIGDATGLRGSTTAGVFWISLHTGSPGETGTQTTTEAAYGAYGRISVARSGSGWSVSGNTADNVAAITFPTATSGSETEAHFGIGSDQTTAGNLFLYGALSSGLAVSLNVIPEFGVGALDVTLD